MPDTKLCTECDHFRGSNFCAAPENGTSPVDGQPHMLFASERRSAGKSPLFEGRKCGPDGANFRPKAVRPPRPWWRFW